MWGVCAMIKKEEAEKKAEVAKEKPEMKSLEDNKVAEEMKPDLTGKIINKSGRFLERMRPTRE